MHSYTHKTDEELAFLLQADDPKALHACYLRYVQSLHYFVLRTAKSPDLTEDVLQETFARLWQRRKQLDPTQNLKAYLFTIAQHYLLNLLKRAQHEFLILEELKHYSKPEEDTTTLWMDFSESKHVLLNAINSLPKQQREVFIRCKLEGMHYKKVAALFGVSEGTVNSHMVKALRSVKQFVLLNGLELCFFLFMFFRR